jgi:hypothetical protein
MTFTKSALLASVGFLAIATAGQAMAQSVVETEGPTQLDEIVVTGEAIARGNNVVTNERIGDLPVGQNIVDAIKLVPGVSIRGSDALNNDPWTYAINIRGFEVNQRSSKIGQTLDGLPLFNASYYLGGSPAQKYVITASVDRIMVSQGTADVGSPAANALGGTLAYFTRQPTDEAGVFRLVRGEPQFEGMRFEVLAEAGSGGSVTVRKLVMRFDQMVGREAVEGTSLDVGAPIIRSRASTHALTLKAGQRAVLSAPALDESGETLLVVLEAAVVESPGEESKPHTKDAGGR